ncbi:MAG: DUF167 domain-containing protein [Alphaproteobacteria bacterium]|nr:DUF167 domain-containing protein [Alphaproteobacteria bacterium]MDE1931263.1 DUF167 domain-containing protein [Alphaproteobacteria bacterium]
MPLPFRLGRDGATLAVRVTPKSAQNRVLGLSEEADGVALRLAVHAPPQAGEANAAVLGLLARHFGLRKSDLRIATGITGRRKLVHIDGDPAALAARLEQGLKSCPKLD